MLSVEMDVIQQSKKSHFQSSSIIPALKNNFPDLKNKLARIHILVVEDNQIARIAYSAFLKISGFTVDFAEDGLKALEVAKAKYKVILMDINLPHRTGIDVTAQIRSQQKEYGNPIIIGITANTQKNILQKRLDVGMNEVMNKPASAEQIINTLKRHIRF